MFKNIFNKEVKSSKLIDETVDFDISLYALESLIELEDKSYNIIKDHMISHYLYLKEGNESILIEGLSDVSQSIVDFFVQLGKKIKEFMEKAYMFLRSYIGNFDKFLKKYHNKINELEPDFNIQGFEYSIEPNKPNIDRITNIVRGFKNELEEVMKMSKEQLLSKRESFTLSDSMDKIRSEVIHSSSPIGSESFIDECKKFYRSNASEEMDIHVNKQYLSNVLSKYNDTKKLLETTKTDKNKLIQLVTSMEDFFKRAPAINYVNNTKHVQIRNIELNNDNDGIRYSGDSMNHKYDVGLVEKINIYYNYKFIQSKTIGGICVSAVTEKVNALNECIKFYEKIIRKSLFNEKSPGKDDQNE